VLIQCQLPYSQIIYHMHIQTKRLQTKPCLNYSKVKLMDNNLDEIDSLLILEMNAFRRTNTMLILLLSAK
jgi:hypothetical protein